MRTCMLSLEIKAGSHICRLASGEELFYENDIGFVIIRNDVHFYFQV